jgi:Cu/Zn superoxide dismutase
MKHFQKFRSTLAASLLVAASTATAAFSVTAPASAQAATQTYQVNLTQANNSGASGTATVTLSGNNAKVSVRATGLSANLPHVIHIHVGGQNVCPTAAADTDKDGFVNVKEATPYVGDMKVALTTSGDTSANSGLATDRAPKADAKGNLSYDRSFALPSGVSAASMAKSTIDIHGISSLFNDKAKYDGDKKSDLDNKLPFETTVPAACGVLSTTPVGGADTGVGSTAGIENPGLLVGGTLAIIGGAAAFLYSRRMAYAQAGQIRDRK